MRDLRERLGKEWLVCDGGTGTILQSKGLKGGELPETWNLTRPEDIIDLHCGYLRAGCDIFNTNTFGANALKLPGNLKEVVTAAVELAKEARRRAGREDAYIALDIGPTGKLLEPLGDLSFDRAVELFGEVVRYGSEAGADLVLIETMSDSYEAKAAVLAAKENCGLPVCITVTFDEKGKLLTGGSVDSTVALLEGLRVDALGVNCGLGPEQMIPIVERLTQVCSIPVIVNPNAGLPRTEGGRTVYNVGPEEFSDWMEKIAAMGVHVVGGCCGTTPDHIRLTAERVKKLPFREPVRKRRTVVSSFSQCVEIGPLPVIIGERINPTGKKKFKQALRDNDIEYILREGLRQEDSGAHILDVNVGLPEIDEPSMMASVVQKLQSVLDLPLQIDTTNVTAMESALRRYNGKAMINSVNGKEEVMKEIFPLVKKYGGLVVCLTLDEDGIPDTAEKRVEIAEKIIRRAGEFGIDKKDLIFDTLAMTVSADSRAALATLESLNTIRNKLGCNTSLGVSNISFGLPNRDIITSVFFTLAMENGLSAAIMNPNSSEMMKSYYSFRALHAIDDNCTDYIENIGKYITAAAPVTTAVTDVKNQSAEFDSPLQRAIVKGLKEQAAELTKDLLNSEKPLDIVTSHIIPALDIVGKGFENKTMFLPQLLMSAEASQCAFEQIKKRMADTAESSVNRGKFVIATVHGDIHDIGKNIVKLILENYGFEVFDLGKDVPPETVVNAVVEQKAPLVGLSALMTTTVPAMEETIKLLRRDAPWAKVLVGGAVLTQEYADRIGADFYGKDAMATVRYATEVMEHTE